MVRRIPCCAFCRTTCGTEGTSAVCRVHCGRRGADIIGLQEMLCRTWSRAVGRCMCGSSPAGSPSKRRACACVCGSRPPGDVAPVGHWESGRGPVLLCARQRTRRISVCRRALWSTARPWHRPVSRVDPMGFSEATLDEAKEADAAFAIRGAASSSSSGAMPWAPPPPPPPRSWSECPSRFGTARAAGG